MDLALHQLETLAPSSVSSQQRADCLAPKDVIAEPVCTSMRWCWQLLKFSEICRSSWESNRNFAGGVERGRESRQWLKD